VSIAILIFGLQFVGPLISMPLVSRPRLHQIFVLLMMLDVVCSAEMRMLPALFGVANSAVNTSLVHSLRLSDEINEFQIAVQFGQSAEQTVVNAFDTGSDEIWYGSRSPGINFCSYPQDNGRCYDRSKSSKYSWVDDDLVIKYMDGSNAIGSHVQDDAIIPTMSGRCLHST
jgi:Eukaryotic aspartyl protease